MKLFDWRNKSKWINESKKHKNLCRVLNYIDNSPNTISTIFFLSTITGYFSISAFASLVGVSIGITSFSIELKICVITAGHK